MSNLLSETIRTPFTDLMGISNPVVLAGMNGVAHAKLVAAVSNAGGLGVIGGLSFTPKTLRAEIAEIKRLMRDPSLPFGVDLALPQVGGSARKTNHDYTHGKLPELTQIIIDEGARLFVCAVGVPPKEMVDKLHAAGIPVMNMVGHPKHVKKALDVGVDLICAQGTEGGGHTGDVATTVLLPQCVEACRGRVSPLTGKPIMVLCGGGIFDGRGLAAALSLGASAVWVGTRFIACKESSAPKRHKQGVIQAGVGDTTRTLIYSGRPLRVLETEYVADWNNNRRNQIEDLTSKGILPFSWEMKKAQKDGKDFDLVKGYPLLMGQAAGAVQDVPTAAEIIQEMVSGAINIMRTNVGFIVGAPVAPKL